MAELSGAARRHARWRDLTEAETGAAVAELRKIAGDRADLLAEVAGIMLGASEGQPGESRSKGAARLCIAAGAHPEAIPAWIEEGRRRGEIRRRALLSNQARHAPRRP